MRINAEAESVVVKFDAEKTTPDRIMSAAEEIIAAHSLGILQREREKKNRLLVEELATLKEKIEDIIAERELAVESGEAAAPAEEKPKAKRRRRKRKAAKAVAAAEQPAE